MKHDDASRASQKKRVGLRRNKMNRKYEMPQKGKKYNVRDMLPNDAFTPSGIDDYLDDMGKQ